MESADSHLDLSADAPILDIMLPKMILEKINHQINPEHEFDKILIPDWHFYCFENLSQTEIKPPQVSRVIKGQPHMVHAFINSKTQVSTLDLGPIGAVVLSRNPLKLVTVNGIHQHLIPIFLSYALSNDLWGPKGKWTRIHDRLVSLFQKSDLLESTPSVGFYPLRLKARTMENSGIRGTLEKERYTLTLPWGFPLSAVTKIEKIIERGL